MHFLDHFEY